MSETRRFDPQFVVLLARLHSGNALAHLKRQDLLREERPVAWTRHEMIAASSFVIASSLWSLVSAKDALESYRRAAALYFRMQHDFWIVLSLFAGPEEISSSLRNERVDGRQEPPQSVAFRMIHLAVEGRDWRGPQRELEAYWRHYGNAPVGRLGIPLDHYVRCAKGMSDRRALERTSRRNHRVFEGFMPAAVEFFARASDVLMAASHDKYHWSRLHSSLLPAEPEAAAMATAMSRVARQRYGSTLREMLAGQRLSEHSQLLVEVGDSLVAAEVGEGGQDRLR